MSGICPACDYGDHPDCDGLHNPGNPCECRDDSHRVAPSWGEVWHLIRLDLALTLAVSRYRRLHWFVPIVAGKANLPADHRATAPRPEHE